MIITTLLLPLGIFPSVPTFIDQELHSAQWSTKGYNEDNYMQ
jgi:hypothetical protein